MAKRYTDLGFAKVDLLRQKITGHPEIIFCTGKTPLQVAKIAQILLAKKQNVLATKASKATASSPSRLYCRSRELLFWAIHGILPVWPDAGVAKRYFCFLLTRLYFYGFS